MSEWKECLLSDVADLCLGKMLDAKKNKGVLHPYLNNVAVRWGAFDLDGLPQMRFEDSEFERYTVRRNDVVACEGGEPGRCAIWKSDEPVYIQKALHRIRAKAGVCAEFLYYQFSHLVKTGQTRGLESGTTIRHLPGQALAKVELRLPSLPTQRKIAAVLGALDDKIELNRKMNANLEAMAQALFKSWFVDFEPFGGTKPAGWRESNLLEIADYVNGLAMQKFRPAEGDVGLPVLKIAELRQGVCDTASERCKSDIDLAYVAEDGDVIFSWSGSLLVDFWCGGRAGVNQHLFKVTSKKYDKWFYYAWTRHHLVRFVKVAADMATTMGHIKRGELAEAKVIVPSDDGYRQLGKMLDPIYARMIDCRLQSRTLAQLRDALLPKLMSGELDVEAVTVEAERGGGRYGRVTRGTATVTRDA